MKRPSLELIPKPVLWRDRAKSSWSRPEVEKARRRTEVRREPFSPTTQNRGLCSRSQSKEVLGWVLLSVLIFSVFSLNGCLNNAANKKVEVIVDGNGQFPASLAGIWQTENGSWQIILEPDGKISSAVVSLGRVTLAPGKTTTVPMEMGGKGIFKPGPWTIQYSKQQRELIVEIVIDSFRIELGENIIKGNTRDFFIGNVSKDGTLWWAQRYSYPQYTVDTEKFPNYKLPTDPNENPKESLLFHNAPETE